jgi:epoxyqueuosine reductase
MGIFVGSVGKNGYRPPLIHQLLKPRIKGNTINGLGERSFRRPRPVYHFREVPGVKLAFKWVQQVFYLRMHRTAEFHDRIEERRFNILRPLDSIAPHKVDKPPEQSAREVKAFALANEADLVGIVAMKQDWVFDGFEVMEPWIIMLGVGQDYAKIATAPDYTTNMEVLDQYNRGHRAGFKLANWIRAQGWYAERYKGFLGTPLTMIPPAIEAGFGELGKHGSLISRKYGPNFRLSYVLTDMPLVADARDDIHVDDFCTGCQLCTRDCPTGAISEHKQWVRGVEKWYVDFDKCVPFFNDTFGCNVCIAVCPFSRPGVSENLVQKLHRRRLRAEQRARRPVGSADSQSADRAQ